MAKKKDNRWGNLLKVLAAVIVIAIIYVLLSGESLFAQPDMSQAWKDEGLDTEFMHADFEELMALSEESLNNIRADLVQFEATSQGADKALSSIYIDLVDAAILSKRAQTETLALEASEEDLCVLLPRYVQLNTNMGTISELMLSVSEKGLTFVEQYPEDAERTQMYGSFNEMMVLKENVEDQATNLALLAGDCE